MDLKFRISPAAFFQVNTAAAQVLYSVIRELITSGEVEENPVIYGMSPLQLVA